MDPKHDQFINPNCRNSDAANTGINSTLKKNFLLVVKKDFLKKNFNHNLLKS